eukprot:TRINITY_DN3960_c0_g1_i1.p1 TRINITY_DN3960_c0_g1~~TRINITY_DN3960_c0_g1_i1.p1  ORF type:complete len:440 (+),score=69.11 TRINITY_DN3960_c0_g1_i1:129-1322(+)
MDLSWNPVKVSVQTFKLVDQPWSTKPYIDYTISIEMNRHSWTLEKRYNQLLALHQFITTTKKADAKIIPSFPSYSMMDLRPLEEVAAERKDMIEYYLEYVLNIDAVFDSLEVQVFFEFGSALPEPRKTIVIIPLPDTDFSVAEVAITWKVLTAMGVFVEFATETGSPVIVPNWSGIKDRSFFQGLSADVRRYFFELTTSASFTHPLAWEDMRPARYSGLALLGGAGYGMVPYIESTTLQAFCREYWKLRRPVGAIGEGVILLARTKQPNSSLSIIHSCRTTTFPKTLETANSYINKLTFWKKSVKSSNAMYSTTCEAEVVSHLSHGDLLQQPPFSTASLFRDSLFNTSPSFTFLEDFYLSARWAGDSYSFARKFFRLVVHSEFSTDGDEKETYPSSL